MPLHLHLQLHHPSIGYLGLAVASFFSWAGLPGPGETALVAAGVLASQGHGDLTTLLFFSALGATLGGIVGWLVGLKVGARLMAAPGPFRKYRQASMERGQELFRRRGWIAVFLTPAWSAGISRMPTVRYLVANLVSALIWAFMFGLGAFLVGPSLTDFVGDIGTVGIALLVLSVVGGVALNWWRQRRTAATSSGS